MFQHYFKIRYIIIDHNDITFQLSRCTLNKLVLQHRKFEILLIVDSLNESRLKSVRFLVEESHALMTNDALAKIIKINH
jgi:hypothetical protein